VSRARSSRYSGRTGTCDPVLSGRGRAHRAADLVLLDLGLPDIEGLVVLRRLRQVSAVPALVLTARGDERSVVRGLRCGADDYVVKPIRLGELLARMEVVTRRSAARGGSPQQVVRVADVCLRLPVRVRTCAAGCWWSC
jgi:DNA-binding response OmpR family regulator